MKHTVKYLAKIILEAHLPWTRYVVKKNSPRNRLVTEETTTHELSIYDEKKILAVSILEKNRISFLGNFALFRPSVERILTKFLDVLVAMVTGFNLMHIMCTTIRAF